MTRVFFLSLLFHKFDDRFCSNFHRFVILCICWDSPTVKASLWRLSIVFTAFKPNTCEKNKKPEFNADLLKRPNSGKPTVQLQLYLKSKCCVSKILSNNIYTQTHNNGFYRTISDWYPCLLSVFSDTNRTHQSSIIKIWVQHL